MMPSLAPSTLLLLPAALLVVLALEQLIATLAKTWRLRQEPLVSDQHRIGGYERSIFTWGVAELRPLWAALAGSALALWLAGTAHVAWALPALALLAAAVWQDLRSWECVAISPWQIAWRRGWRRSVRRLPAAQIARVHRAGRRAPRDADTLTRWRHQFFGHRYLALELHNGRAVKLPRTSAWAGGREVRIVAELLRTRQLEVVQQRREMARLQARAERRARRLRMSEAALDLQQEIAELRAARSRNQRLLAISAQHELPPPDPTRPAPETLMLG